MCLKMDEKIRYSVLYVQALKQKRVTDMLRQNMPDGKGTVFYPCTELWMNGSDKYVIRPLFPGYIFIRSTLDKLGLHKLVKESNAVINAYVKNISKETVSGDYSHSEIYDFTDDEANFLDFLLSFKYQDDDRQQDKEDQSIPAEGVIRMSRGYEEKEDVYVVVEGPLKGLEQYIVDVNKRDRKAYLDIEIAGHRARAGLEIYAKKYFFPHDNSKTDMLENGQAIDTNKLAQSMMRGRD